MSRVSLVLIVILVVIVAGLLWLSRGSGGVAPHRIEQPVTLDGAA